MNIFEKRPLSLILCIMLGGFSLFAEFNIFTKLIISAISLTLLSLTFVFRHKFEGRIVMIRMLLIAFSTAVALSALWSYLFYPTAHYDKEVKVEAKIYDINTESYNSKITLKTTVISGKKDKHTLLLYIDRDTANTLKKYDIVELTATLKGFGDTDASSGKNYYVGNGISGYLEDLSSISVKGNSVDKLDKILYDTRLKLSNMLKKRTDFETGAFLAALIIGNRDDLDGNTRLNFARSGISHILALSGMHLAILSAAITKLLSLLHINKKYRVITVSILTLLYMALTGFSPSVVRSGIMLIITGVLYLLSRNSDSITSLFIAVSVILIITPCSAFDLSLWLSAFATLGVIVFSELKGQEERDKTKSTFKKTLFALRDGVMVSAFAFGATFAISVFSFKAFSVVSLFSTLIFAFLIEIFIYAGLVSLAIGWLIPIRLPLIALSDTIKSIAEFISDMKLVYVSAESFLTILLLCMFSLFFFAFIILYTDKKKLCLKIICSLLIASFTVAEIDTLIARYTDDVIYSPDSSGDTFLIKDNGDIFAIYSGKSQVSSSYSVLDTLDEEKITYLDTLVLTSYSYTTVQFCKGIIDSIKTNVILVPAPITRDEINQAEGLSEMLSLYGTDMRFYEVLDTVALGSYSYKLIDKVAYTYGEYPMNVFKLSNSNFNCIYVSAGDYDHVSVDAKAELYNAKRLFIGTTGNSNYYKFDMILPDIKSIIFADSNRLTDNAISYYDSIDADILHIEDSVSIYE